MEGINENIEIWRQSWESIKILKYEWKGKLIVNQNAEIWVQMCESIKNCSNLSKKGEIDQMLIFYCKSGNQSKCCSLIEQINKELIRILKFEDSVGNQSKCWNLSAKCQVDQNVEIWVKRGDWSKCPNLSERGYRWKHWNLKTELGTNQMLKFEC